MKARNRIEENSTFVSRSRCLPGQDRILQQIKIITADLDALQAEIYRRMSKPGGVPRKRPPVDEAATARAMAQFKAALDRLRHVLWFYLEQFAHEAKIYERWEPLEHDRGKFAGLRQVLVPQSSEASSPEAHPPGSFFDRLNLVVDNYLKAAPLNNRKRTK